MFSHRYGSASVVSSTRRGWRAGARGLLLDALAVNRDEQLAPVDGGDHPAQVRRPHAVLSAAWMSRPDIPLEPAGDRPR